MKRDDRQQAIMDLLVTDGEVEMDALADLVGQAAASLAAADRSTEAVVAHFSDVAAALKIACFCTASSSLKALKAAPLIEAPAFL